MTAISVAVISSPDFCYAVFVEPDSLVLVQINTLHVVTELAIDLVCIVHILNVHPRLFPIYKDYFGILVLPKSFKLIFRRQ